MKNILFLVTGKTTPIITETVWALACDPKLSKSWIPHEIHILSTEEGLDHIRMDLFDNEELPMFEKFKRDYPQLKNIHFNGDDCLHVFENKEGKKLNDLRTPEDNEIAADIICQKVHEFTNDDNVCLHVSIAGGRKTMGFYAGYALSLYGRAQDAMSHVLVEEDFENAEGFYYPTPPEANIRIKNRAGKPVNTSKAKVWLANIPFVRMRDAIIKKHQLNPENHQSFSKVVNDINQSFEPITLSLYVKKRHIQVNDGDLIRLSPKYFALLHWFAENKLENRSVSAPGYNSSDVPKDYFDEWSIPFNKYYGLHQATDDIVVDKEYFEIAKSKLCAELVKKLGSLEVVNRIAPVKNKANLGFVLPKDLKIIIKDKK